MLFIGDITTLKPMNDALSQEVRRNYQHCVNCMLYKYTEVDFASSATAEISDFWTLNGSS
jgi:hypothetical protein